MTQLNDGIPTMAAMLLREIVADPWGKVSISPYETARLVGLAPWLTGHAARVEYLCASQRSDGSWGAPDGYAVVPTLSATEALMSRLSTGRPGDGRRAVDDQRLVRVAGRGLRALRRWFSPGSALAIPDTIAVEVLVPALVRRINQHLDRRVQRAPRLLLPPGMAVDPATAMLSRIDDGGGVPRTWWASLEALADAAPRVPGVRPTAGAVACSAAATAAYAGPSPRSDDEMVRFLEKLQARGGGPVPAVTPITNFERAWTLYDFADAGIGTRSNARSRDIEMVLDQLADTIGEKGAPAAAGLPPDSDDTAVILAVLARYGRWHCPDSLLEYRVDRHFCCFAGERNVSVSANAHVLDAFDRYLLARVWDHRVLAGVATDLAGWLCDMQSPDGSWLDKWHASAYYATFCCVSPLCRRGDESARRAVRAAVDWILQTQRGDGSWGRWEGTAEETAYAVRTLVAAHSPVRGDGVRAGAAAHAVAAGRDYLLNQPVTAAHRGLWHGKDLYAPLRVIRAARLAAIAIGSRFLADVGQRLVPVGGGVLIGRAPARIVGAPARRGDEASARRRYAPRRLPTR